MGYEVGLAQFSLDFTGTPYAGMHVKVKSLTVGEFNDLFSTPADEEDAVVKQDRLFETFADRLVSWDLEQNGFPIGTDLASIKGIDANVVQNIISAWQRAITNVPTNSSTPLRNGRKPDASLGLADTSTSSHPGS